METRPYRSSLRVTRNPGDYFIIPMRARRRQIPARISLGFVEALLKKYRRTFGLVKGLLFHLRLRGNIEHQSRTLCQSYNFLIVINNRIFPSISRILGPSLLRSEQFGNFTAYASSLVSKLSMQEFAVGAPSTSFAGAAGTAISLRTGSGLAAYLAARLDSPNTLPEQEVATRFPSTTYADKTNGMRASYGNRIHNGNALWESMLMLRPGSHHSPSRRQIVHAPDLSTTQQLSGRGIPSAHDLNVNQGLTGIRKTPTLRQLHMKITSHRVMTQIASPNSYAHRITRPNAGANSPHLEVFPQKGNSTLWMPAVRSWDNGPEMTHVPIQFSGASPGMVRRTKKEAGTAATASVQETLTVKGPEVDDTLSAPKVDIHGLAKSVYGLIVDRVRREKALRGR